MVDRDRVPTALERIIHGQRGTCWMCGEQAIPKCYSDEGRREFAISGLCEPCFDDLNGEEDEPIDKAEPGCNDPLDDDRDQENPVESQNYDNHDWDNDPDWR